MNMKKMSVNRLVRCAVIAAVYVVVCLGACPVQLWGGAGARG